MPHNLQALLKRKKVLISDGAWGTELVKRGMAGGEAPELWNREKRSQVKSIAESYVKSGSDIILTNTFGANRLKLDRYGLSTNLVELNSEGVIISKECAGTETLVFASIGPTGEFMPPMGTRTREEIVDCFSEQIEACAQAGADGIVVESMTDLNEATAALSAARSVCNLPVVCCLTFDKGQRGYATIMGVSPEKAARELDDAGADVVGSNCGTGIDDIIEVAVSMRRATQKPLWMKPNAGLPQLVHGTVQYTESPHQTATRVVDLIQAGANIMGGCCGTTPDHIRLIIKTVKEFMERK